MEEALLHFTVINFCWQEPGPETSTCPQHSREVQAFRALQKDHTPPCFFLVEPKSQSPNGEAALIMYQHPQVSACLQNVQGFCQTLLLFLQAGEKTGNCFNHTSISPVQPMQLHATFLASLETPFYCLVIQGCKSACTYIICRYPSTFATSGHSSLFNEVCKLASPPGLPN